MISTDWPSGSGCHIHFARPHLTVVLSWCTCRASLTSARDRGRPSYDSKAKEGEAEGVTIFDTRCMRTDAASAKFPVRSLENRSLPFGTTLFHDGAARCGLARTPLLEPVQKSRVPDVKWPGFPSPLADWVKPPRPRRSLHARGHHVEKKLTRRSG